MLKLWARVCDPFGRKVLKRRIAELEAALVTRPEYSADVRYMEQLALGIIKELPPIPDVHPDTRHEQRIVTAFKCARVWMKELHTGTGITHG